MKIKSLLTLGALVAASASASAVTLVDATYTTNQTLAANQWFLEGGSTVTWTINSGVTINTGVNDVRFYLGTNALPNTGVASFVITGGGTFIDSNAGAFAFRLGQDNSNGEPGSLIITGGSTFQMTPTSNGLFSQNSASSLVLSGLGSTAVLRGTYTATDLVSGTYSSGNANSQYPLNVSAIGGTILSSFDSVNNVTTLSVVPEPSTYGILGAGALAGVAFVRRRRKAA